MLFSKPFFDYPDNSMDKIVKIIKALERKLNIINLIQFLHFSNCLNIDHRITLKQLLLPVGQ